MSEWLPHALTYVDSWLSHQMRATEQPGCSVAVIQGADFVMERAHGSADLARGIPITTRHRFRVASYSKAFTAAAVMLLKEAGRLRLDDPVGIYVPDLHPSLALTTLGQLLSHSAGILRDGSDAATGAMPVPDRTFPTCSGSSRCRS